MNGFFQLFRSVEARQLAEEALEYTLLGWMHRAASYWSLAYNVEKHFRENEEPGSTSEK